MKPPFQIRPHRQNFVLLGRWSDSPNQAVYDAAAAAAGTQPIDLDPIEVAYQISFKVKLDEEPLLGGNVWAGYTQLAQWQAYNGGDSSPFREINYEPELIWSRPIDADILGLHASVLNLGFVHQSNGTSEPLSRGWNRLYAQVGLERDDVSLLVRSWWRIPTSSGNDSNPDIGKYLGHGDLVGVWKHGGHTVSLLVRNNLEFDENRGALQADWSFPINGGLRGYLRVFSGYGESLIDYDHAQTTIGLGLMLTDLL